MKKKNSLYTFILLIILGCSMVGCSASSSTISIINNTDTTITNLRLKYSNSDEDYFELPNLSKSEKYDLKFELPENFTEGYIKICYLDNENEIKEEYIEGYIEKGYNKNIVVYINSIDNSGLLTFDVKNN